MKSFILPARLDIEGFNEAIKHGTIVVTFNKKAFSAHEAPYFVNVNEIRIEESSDPDAATEYVINTSDGDVINRIYLEQFQRYFTLYRIDEEAFGV